MRGLRFPLKQGLVMIAIIGLNASLLRSFFLHEMFIGAIILMALLQVGVWLFLKSRGRWRRFWAGFEAAGVASIIYLIWCEYQPSSMGNRVVILYTDFVSNLAYAHVAASWEDSLEANWNLFLVVVYFLPELVAAILGGLIAAFIPWKGLTRRPPSA
ncbi:hypothetical protein [Singulisphaera sp. PoT]|uniref:hypothetical protein n=1 Tax=Singulisphaera sp. PoT TaxID=3411797 RepID=UPI003BF55717